MMKSETLWAASFVVVANYRVVASNYQGRSKLAGPGTAIISRMVVARIANLNDILVQKNQDKKQARVFLIIVIESKKSKFLCLT